jgi:hypothetical protein
MSETFLTSCLRSCSYSLSFLQPCLLLLSSSLTSSPPQGFTNDGDAIQDMMQDTFRWTNLCNDLSVDATFGSNFAISSHPHPQRVHPAHTVFSD